MTPANMTLSKVGRGLLLALALAAITTGLALASSTESWWWVTRVSGGSGRSFQTSTARDPTTGDLFVAWTDDSVSDWEDVLGRRWDGATRRWSLVEDLSQSAPWQRDGGPVLIFDEQGQGLLVWTRTYGGPTGHEAGHDVLWRWWDGDDWSPPAVLFQGDSYLPGSPGVFGLIPALTPQGFVLIVTWNNGFRLAEFRDGGLVHLDPWDYDSLRVFLVQALVDQGGLMHVAALGENTLLWGWNAAFQDAYYLTYDGTSWSQPVNLSGTLGVARDIGMAFDDQGRLHFLWSDPNNPLSDESQRSAIWERVMKQGAWGPNSPVTSDGDRQVINGFSLAADTGGGLHLAWSEGLLEDYAHVDLDIYYRSGDGVVWDEGRKVFTSTAESRHPLLTVDDGEVGLAWQEIYTKPPPEVADQDVYAAIMVNRPRGPFQAYLPLIAK